MKTEGYEDDESSVRIQRQSSVDPAQVDAVVAEDQDEVEVGVQPTEVALVELRVLLEEIHFEVG